MKRFSILLAVVVLIPATASAVPCHAVDYFFAPSSDSINSANIVKSGWGKFTLFQTPVPPSGWFYFADGKRAFAVNQGVVGPLQWGVDMQSVRDGSDCNPILPSPLDPEDGESNQPSNPGNSVTLLYCVGNTPNFALSFWNGSPIVPVTDFRVERLWGGSWDPWFDGGSTCVVSQGSQTGFTYRVRAENAAGVSDWINLQLLYNCQTGGGGEM